MRPPTQAGQKRALTVNWVVVGKKKPHLVGLNPNHEQKESPAEAGLSG